MNTTFLLTNDYEQITMNNEPIKTNPNKPNLKDRQDIYESFEMPIH